MARSNGPIQDDSVAQRSWSALWTYASAGKREGKRKKKRKEKKKGNVTVHK